MKTTGHELDQKAKQYILDCISCEDRELKTNDEKIDYIKNRFYNEVRPMQRLYMNRINIIENWIRRLPLPINIEYNNSKILELSISWGYLSEDATEQIKEYTIDHYWNFIATQINHLFTGFRIPKEGK